MIIINKNKYIYIHTYIYIYNESKVGNIHFHMATSHGNFTSYARSIFHYIYIKNESMVGI